MLHRNTTLSAGRLPLRAGLNRRPLTVLLLMCLVTMAFVLSAPPSHSVATLRPRLASAAITSPLQVSSVNSHYLTDASGRAVYLSGSHTWDTMQDMSLTSNAAPAFDFNSYVNFLLAHGQNMTVLWRKDLPTFCNWGAGGTWHVRQFPWPRTGPAAASDGLPAFDLSQFDQSYFDRLRARVVQLGQNNIYATVQLFDGLQLLNNRCSNDGYPFTGGNNVNGVSDGGGTGSMTMSGSNAITNFQDAFVKKVIDTVGDQPNVLWEISEEAPSNSTWWQDHMISVIHSYEAGKPMRHPVGYPWLTGGSDSTIYSSAADWVAPVARVSPGSNSGNKAIVNDSDHSYFGMWNDSAQTNRNYIWENFTSGSSVIFMDPYEIYWSSGNRNLCANPAGGVCNGVDSRWDNFRNNLGYSVAYANKMNLVAMTPQGNRSSTGWTLANTSATGSEFLVYAPNGGSFSVDLSNTTRTLNAEWLNPSTGVTSSAGTVNGGSNSQNFTPPFGGDAVLHVWDAGTIAPNTSVRVNTGSTYTDSAGNVWSSASGFNAGNTSSVSHSIAGTQDQSLYQTERWGNTFSYSAAVTNGNYNVTLKFAENYWTGRGQRVFNVAINGTPVLTNFDILAQSAPNTALDKTFPVTITNGSVTISFSTVADNAKVDSLSILPVSTPPTTTTTAATTTTTTAATTTTTTAATTTTTTAATTTTTTASTTTTRPPPTTTTTQKPASPPAFVQVSAATPQSPQSSVSTTFSQPQTAGNANVIAIGWNDTTSSIASVTDTAGNSYSIAAPTTRGAGVSQAVFYAASVKGGPNTVTVRFNQAADFVDVRIVEYSGFNAVNPLGTSASAAGGSSTATSGSASTTSGNTLLFGAGITTGLFTGTGNGYAKRIITNPDGDLVEDQTVSGAGTYAATAPQWGNWVMQLVAFRGA